MLLELGFGKGTQPVEIPDGNLLAILEPNQVEYGLTGEAEVRRALKEPIGTPPLGTIVKPGERVAIVTSDITRPMPTYKVMPALLDELYAAGICREDITLVFALGSHRPHTPEEMRRLAGERAYSEITCIDGDPGDCVPLGFTKRGTPIDIVRPVAEAHRRICIGNIEYHYFAGYSGGGKAIMPGVSTREAIQSNHSLMVLPGAVAGQLDGNPVREDIEDAAGICGIDFIVNVVLDEHKEIIRAVAGHPVQAYRAGCAYLDTLFRCGVDEKADIVIVSQGGYPKDSNLYQTQKALDNAKHVVKDGGVIILVGSCREGMGEAVFQEWMTGAADAPSLITRIRQDFQLGGHKAAAIAMVLQRAEVYLVSDLPSEFVAGIFLKPYSRLQDAFDDAVSRLGSHAKVIAMPYGGSTLPTVKL